MEHHDRPAPAAARQHPTHTFSGKRILVVEDDYFIAKGLARDLRSAGANVVGPVPTVSDALALIEADALDGAVVDVNLRGEMAFPVAEMLLGRSIPFVLATGYGPEALPHRFSGLARCDKPIDVGALAAALFRHAA